MAGNSWSIKIVKGNPCTFEPDVYCPPGTPKPTVLTAETNDLISWDNQTSQAHQICSGDMPGSSLGIRRRSNRPPRPAPCTSSGKALEKMEHFGPIFTND